MTTSHLPQWLDEDHPHEPEQAELQLRSLRSLLGPVPRRVLDLGCGSGRVLVELARDGHAVTGMDRNLTALNSCRLKLQKVDSAADLVHGDFLHDTWPNGPFDVVLCLGNTFMTVVEINEAVCLLTLASEAVSENGSVVLDDLPGDFWPELTEGHWQSGLAEDGSAQMIWGARDSVFALRFGDAIDETTWQFKPEDRRFRLWTASALSLACFQAGLSEPTEHPGLLVMTLGSKRH